MFNLFVEILTTISLLACKYSTLSWSRVSRVWLRSKRTLFAEVCKYGVYNAMIHKGKISALSVDNQHLSFLSESSGQRWFKSNISYYIHIYREIGRKVIMILQYALRLAVFGISNKSSVRPQGDLTTFSNKKWPHTRQIKISGRNHILPPLGIENTLIMQS